MDTTSMRPTPELLYEIRKFRQIQIDCVLEFFFCLILSLLCFLLSKMTTGCVSWSFYITYLFACIGLGANTGQFFSLHSQIKDDIAEYLKIRQVQKQQDKEDLS